MSAKKKIAKLEALAREATSLRSVDLNGRPEFEVSKKVRLLDASCCGSLMKENRIEEEIILCADKTDNLNSKLLSFRCKVVDSERAHHSLEVQNWALQEHILKVEERIAVLELLLKGSKQQIGFHPEKGEVQLKVREHTSKLESQTKKIITRDEVELPGETIKLMKSDADNENAQIVCKVNALANFRDGETARNKTKFRREICGERKISDVRGNEEYLTSVREFYSSRRSSGCEKLEVRQFSDKLLSSNELSQRKDNVERIFSVDFHTFHVWDKSRSLEHQTHHRETLSKSRKSSELNSESEREVEKDGSTNTLGKIRTSKRFIVGKDHPPKPQNEEKLSAETNKEFATDNQASIKTEREAGIYRLSLGSKHYSDQMRIGTQFSGRSLETKNDVGRRGQERASNFPFFITDRNFRHSEKREDSGPNDCSENLSVEQSGDVIYNSQALSAEVGTCHYEEGTLEGDLLKLRAKLSVLESYINKLIQEKSALLNELSETKETAEKKVLENAKFLFFLSNARNVKEEVSRKEANWKDQFLFESDSEYAADDFHKVGELATGLQGTAASMFQTDSRHLEEELIKLQANRHSHLESFLEESLRDKTALLAELYDTKSSNLGEKSDHKYPFYSPSINGLEALVSCKSCEQTFQKGRIFLEISREISGEVRKFRELAADLQTKYTTCKTELEKQRTILSTLLSREEAAIRQAHEDARELQLKLKKSHLDIVT